MEDTQTHTLTSINSPTDVTLLCCWDNTELPLSVVRSLQVVSLSDYDYVQEVSKEGSKKSPSPGYPLVCVTPCDPHYPKYSVMRERCEEAGINQTSVSFSWEVAAPTDTSGARSPFETVTDTTPYTSVNHMVSLPQSLLGTLGHGGVQVQ